MVKFENYFTFGTMAICVKCFGEIGGDDVGTAVKCSACDLFCHHSCTGLRGKPRGNWRCQQCRRDKASSPCKSSVDGATLINNIDELRAEVNAIRKDMRPKVDLYDQLNHSDLEARIEAVETKLKDLESIKNLISGLQLRINVLEERNHQAEQKERISNLELHGVVEHPNENLSALMVQVGTIVGVPVLPQDIAWVGRVGLSNKSKPRIILAKFYNLETKNAILRASRKRKGIKMQELGYADDRRTVYVNENLTAYYRNLYQDARKLKPQKFEFVWTYNCRIYVRKTKEDKPIPVTSKNQLPFLN